MTKFLSGIAARGSFKRQIIVAFVVGFLLLISAFSVYLVSHEKEKLYRDSGDAAIGLAQSLAVSSLSWVLADDVVGLQEVVSSFQKYPELRYPQGLKGEQILLESRILAVADVVEAMASHRPYRAALGIESALQEIETSRGTVYDTAVVDACLRLFAEQRFAWND